MVSGVVPLCLYALCYALETHRGAVLFGSGFVMMLPLEPECLVLFTTSFKGHVDVIGINVSLCCLPWQISKMYSINHHSSWIDYERSEETFEDCELAHEPLIFDHRFHDGYQMPCRYPDRPRDALSLPPPITPRNSTLCGRVSLLTTFAWPHEHTSGYFCHDLPAMRQAPNIKANPAQPT